MNKGSEERKTIALQILTTSGFDNFMPNHIEYMAKVLNLPLNLSSQMRDVKEYLGRWMTDNIVYIMEKIKFQRIDIENYCASLFRPGPERDFIISVLKIYNNRLFGQRPMQSHESLLKNSNSFLNYPTNFMYPNQQYMMPMYPPYPSDQQSLENMEKMYKMHYSNYMQLPMHYPYPHINEGNRLSYPYLMHPDQSSGIPDIPNFYPYGSEQKPMPDMPNIHNQPSLQNFPELKQPSLCMRRSQEEYERAYLRYQEMYDKDYSEKPFVIIPPSKQQKKKQPQYHHLIPNDQTIKPQNIIIHKLDEDKSSQIEVLDKNSEVVKLFRQKKKETTMVSQKKIVYDQKFKFCQCKGTQNDGKSFRCKECGVFYHYRCSLKKENKNQVIDQQVKGKTIEIDIIESESGEKNEKNKQNEEMAGQKDQGEEEEEERQEQERQEICHFCYMKNIDPLNEVTKVAKTCYIRRIFQTKVIEICNFQPFDSYIISKNSPYEIELRCMRMQDAANGVPQYTWPDECIVTLNGQKTIEFPALQQNSSVKKRKDMSVFLTNNIFNYTKNMNQRNHSRIGLEIKYITNAEILTKKIKNNYIFIFGIYLSKKKSVGELYEEIIMDPSNKVYFVQSCFSIPVTEDEVAIQQMKVSLVDPYTWELIETPVRGNKCNHGQCFDLKTYLGFMNNQRARNWRCPICMKETRKFMIDYQQMGVIEDLKRQMTSRKLSKQVTFYRDGRIIFNQSEDSEDEEGQMDNNGNKNNEENNQKNDSKMDEQFAQNKPKNGNNDYRDHPYSANINEFPRSISINQKQQRSESLENKIKGQNDGSNINDPN